MTIDGRVLLSAAAAVQSDYVRMLESFVNMDSGTHDRDLVQKTGEFIAGAFSHVFDTVEWVRSPDPKIPETYVARAEGASKRKVVLLGHHDTVYRAGTTPPRPRG